jgi:phytoene dehydrogenase-like protein
VAVIERLAHPGGRFTAKTFQGAQVSTGAVHMLPFGTNGELAAMLRSLDVPHHIHDAEVFASFHVRRRQYVCRSVLQLAGVLGPRQFGQFIKLGAEMLLGSATAKDSGESYREWLDQRIGRQASPELYAYFERVCHFALSVDLEDVPYSEIVETTKNMFRYGATGIVDGGCAALTSALEREVKTAGGEVRLLQEVTSITSAEGAVTGVRLCPRGGGVEIWLRAPLVISDIGPEATHRLAEPQEGGTAAFSGRREATGLKVHLLSDYSVIPHRGIMYCLDTQRIAGIVQPSNSDARLAPPGKHLLITHQLLRSNDMNVEREAARADLRYLFGDNLGRSVNILTMSQYRGDWPVNRSVQGADAGPATGVSGLYLVGDAVKPSGYLMVEGVAQSVNSLLDQVAAPESSATHVPAKPDRRRAFHWLVGPPPPHPGS